MKRLTLLLFACGSLATATIAMAQTNTARAPFRLITLDPGHFHAALVQKSMYPDVDPTCSLRPGRR